RYGGEEFGVVLRGVGLESAHGVAERLRGIAEGITTSHEGNQVQCTISAGCAALSCCENPTTEALIAVTDRRLYIAKRGGRDRVRHVRRAPNIRPQRRGNRVLDTL